MLIKDDTYDKRVSDRNVVLNLGCGANLDPYSINCDIEDYYGALMTDGHRHYKHPDMLLDLNSPLPFKDESVDAVLLTKVMAHIKHPLKLRKEIDRILRFGGKLHLSACHGCDHSDSKYNIDQTYTKIRTSTDWMKFLKLS